MADHEVRTAKEMGWETLTNGRLLSQAESQFDVMLTVDRNIKHQQNLTGRQIAIVVLLAAANTRTALAPLMPQVEALLPSPKAGQLYEVVLATTPTLSPGPQ